jgi:hypothetical protein
VRTGVPQGKGTTGAVAADYEGNLKQSGFVELIALEAIGGQGAIPEAGEHKRIGRLALGRVEFGHGLKIADC